MSEWQPGPVRVTVEESSFGAVLGDLEPFRSAHTEKVLHRGVVEFRTHGEDEDAIVKRLAIAAKRKGVDVEAGSLAGRWTLGTYTSSYADRSPRSTHHRWQVQESEKLQIAELQVGGLVLHPYRYSERFDNNALVIRARVRFAEAEVEALRALIVGGELYIRVVRHGISEEPRIMRFGRTLWSEQGGVVNHDLVLVDKSYDDQNRPALFEPENSNVHRAVASLLGRVEDLGDLLVSKGVLTDLERRSWQEGADARAGRRELNLWRVTDLDAWLAKHDSDDDEPATSGESNRVPVDARPLEPPSEVST